MEELASVVVSIAFLAIIPIIVKIVTSNRARAHARISTTIDKLIERGDAITPETVQALGIRPSQPNRDLKIGMILTAIALALIFFGDVIPDDEATTIFAGIAAFPGFVGLAYCGFWVMFGRKSNGQ